MADQFSSAFKAALDELTQKYGPGGAEQSPAKQSPVSKENSKPQSSNDAPPPSKPQSTPGFSFTAPAATSTTPSTHQFNSTTSNLFGSSMFSNAVKASPAENSSSTNSGSSQFGGFRFGQLGAPSGTPAANNAAPSSKTTPFGGGSSGLFGSSASSGNTASPGAFSFSGVFPTTGSTTGTNAAKSAIKGTNADDDECQLVGTDHATADEVARARQYLLPDDFYLYRLRKPCPGCPGCDDENNENLSSNPSISTCSNLTKTNTAAAQKSNPSTVQANAFKSQIPSPGFSTR